MDDKTRIFLARSKLRIEVLRKLAEKPQIASFLAKELDMYRETVSRIFLDLQKMDLAKCKNPDEPNFRYYQITELGKKIKEELIRNKL